MVNQPVPLDAVGKTVLTVPTKNGELDHNIALARIGFLQKGAHVIDFASYSEFMESKHAVPGMLLLSSVSLVRQAVLDILKVDLPSIDYPESIFPYLQRDIKVETVEDVLKYVNQGQPIFAKPVKQKLFRGQVFEDIASLVALAPFADDVPVYTSKPVKFVSEWRTYVVDDEIRRFCFYRGVPHITPDFSDAYAVAQTLQNTGESTRSYSIDLGMDTEGETHLIEINDGFSLGNYGLPTDEYAHLILTRWQKLYEDLKHV